MTIKKGQTAIVFAKAVGLLIIGSGLAISTILPWYGKVKQNEENNLVLLDNNPALTVQLFLFRAKNVSFSMPRFTRFRQLLEVYHKQKISFQEARNLKQPKLAVPLNQSVVDISQLKALVIIISRAIALLILLGTTSFILLLYFLRNRTKTQIGSCQQVEAALQKEKNFTQTLFDANPAFFVAIGIDGKVLLMNAAMLSTLGYTLKEVVGQDYLSTFVPESDRHSFSQIFQHHKLQKKSTRTESAVLTKEGKKIFVEWQGRSIFNKDNGEVDFFFAAGIDITERKRTEEEIYLLQKITQAVSLAPDFASALERALHMICEATGWEFGEAWIPNSEQTCLECSSVWYDSGRVSPGSIKTLEKFRQVSETFIFLPNTGLPGRVWSSQHSEWIPDVSISENSLFLRNKIAAECGLKAGFGVPIIADDQVLAVLVFFMFVAQEEDKRLVEIVSSVAMQLGAVFQRKQAVEALQEAEAKYRSMFENAMEGIFQTLPNGQYISANPALAAIYGYTSPEKLMAGLSNFNRQIYFYPNRWAEFMHLLQEKDSVLGFEAQVYRRDGRVIWISQNARAVRDANGQLLYYEGSVIDITERKHTEEQLRYNACHDSLTGLYNRAVFMERLVEAVAHSHQQQNYGFAVLFLDLDDFKLINDSLGHWIGDQMLIVIAWKLGICLRPGDTLARMGGDEFSILLENIQDIQEAIAIAKTIQKTLKQPLKVHGQEVFTEASMGMVHYLGLTQPLPRQPQDLLRDADTALHRAKAQGKGLYVVFDATMREDAVRRLQLETDLRWAIEREEFEVYYQPIVRLATGEISGFEALARWRHPHRGFVSPGEFIPVAEQVGLIAQIGEWVMRESCRQMYLWKQEFPGHSSLRMSINLSGKQLTADLSDRIDKILYETGVDGWDLKLEITETALMEDIESAIATLQRLKSRDIKLCIDDFGTGYSSLSYLHRFPIDILKIDRSFVSMMSVKIENSEIVRTIAALAHSLGMDVIAEGIECTEQLYQLRMLKCKYGQGYLFSKPVNSEAATALLAQEQINDAKAV